MEDLFEVRDHRNKEMFRVDDEYLNGYSKLCGVNATMVYLCLCRHADRHQESFPSIIGMSEKIGISPRSVIRGISILINWNIVLKKRERKKDATWLNNRYILLDKTVWKSNPSATQSLGSQVPNETEPSATQSKSQVPHSHTKDTHIKDTHIKEAPDWLNKGIWDSWIKYRKERKQPLTESSIRLQIKELEKNIPDHIKIIEQSIRNGWSGLFPLKEVKKSSNILQVKKGKYENIK